jgi:hypothetical protein
MPRSDMPRECGSSSAGSMIAAGTVFAAALSVAPDQGCAVSQSCLISFLKFLCIGKVAYAHRLLH